ncbi:MAG: hypothetical protein ABI851_08165 [Saprospiraceae bacterium]
MTIHKLTALRTTLRCLFFVVFNVFFIGIVSTQKQGNNWYFSEKAGINFNTIPPSPINLSPLNTADNSSAISDANGQILFYTDGLSVYNRLNQVMPNGLNLAGNHSGGQATLIVPIPKSNKFVVFSVPDVGNKPLYFSIVNMGLNNKNGDVELKNQILFNNSTEKIAGIYYCSEDFYWVITHQYETDLFYVYKIDKTGLNPVPVISSVGMLHTGGPIDDVNNSAGQLSISKDGKHIASALYYSGEIELFDFDVSTGKISNPKLIPNYSRAWGVEYSEDGSKLYLSQWTQTNITQFDLSSNDINTIISSAITVGNCSGTGGYYSGYLQRGPNGKIYIAQWDSDFLSYIDKPNELGSLCNFSLNGYSLIFGKSKAGLCRVVIPELVSSDMKFLGSDTLICEGSSIILKSHSDSTHWSTGSIGNQIVVSKAGIYWAEILTPCGNIRDTVVINALKCANLCDIQCHNLEWMDWSVEASNVLIGKSSKGTVRLIEDANVGTLYPSLTNYQLNTSKFTPSNINLMPTPWMPGNPSFTSLKHNLILDGLKERKELLILLGEFPNSNLYSKPQISKLRIFDRLNNLLDVSNICPIFRDQRPPHDSILLFYGSKELWFDVNGVNQADGGIIVLTNFPDSTYIIQIEHNNEISSKDDGIYINLGLPNCCVNDTFVIDTSSCNPIVFQNTIFNKSGKYFSYEQAQGCVHTTIINLNLIPKLTLSLPPDTVLCNGTSIALTSPYSNTLWSTGQTGKQIVVHLKGQYWARVDSTCGIISDTIEIGIKDCQVDSCGISLKQTCLSSGQIELSVIDQNGVLVNPFKRVTELFWDIKQGANNTAYSIINKNPIYLNENTKFSMTSKIYSWKGNAPKTIEYADICQSRIIDQSISSCSGPCENFKLILASCNDDYHKNNLLHFPNSLCKSVCSNECLFIVGLFDLKGDLINSSEYDIKWSTGSTDNYVSLMQPYYNTLSVEVRKGSCVWNGKYWKSCDLYKKFSDDTEISKRTSISISDLNRILLKSSVFKIYDINGQQIPEQQFHRGDIPTGIYFIQTIEGGIRKSNKYFIQNE